MKHLTCALVGCGLLLAACSGDDGGATVDWGPGGDVTITDGMAGDGATGEGAPRDRCEPSTTLVGAVDPARLKADLEKLVGFGERRSVEGQKKTADYLRTILSALPGVSVTDHSYSYKGASYVNLVVDIAGVEKSDEWIFAGAHYDSTSNSATVAPGASDNASGTAALVEVARVLSGCQPRRGVRLLFFSNEEKGIIGSTAYVSSIKTSTPPSQVLGYVNVDTIGFGPADEDLDIATRKDQAAFAHAMTAAVKQWTSLEVVEHIDDQCG